MYSICTVPHCSSRPAVRHNCTCLLFAHLFSIHHQPAAAAPPFAAVLLHFLSFLRITPCSAEHTHIRNPHRVKAARTSLAGSNLSSAFPATLKQLLFLFVFLGFQREWLRELAIHSYSDPPLAHLTFAGVGSRVGELFRVPGNIIRQWSTQLDLIVC